MKLSKTTIKLALTLLILVITPLLSLLIYEIYLSSKYYSVIKYECDKYGLNHITVISLIKTESNFNQNAKSRKNAIGLMQIKESTAKYVATLYDIEYIDLYDYKSNITLGVAYLDYLTKKFNYEDLVICAYNAGEGVLSKWIEKGYVEDDKINYIPYKETKNYLSKIKKLKNFYSIFY